VAYRRGDNGRAAALLGEALLISRDIGAREVVAIVLETLAWVTAASDQAELAARLGGAAEALREVIGAPVPPDERADHEQAMQAMRQALGEAGFAAAWAAGRMLPLETAIAEALAAPFSP
jgi:hypothetical protein